MGSFEDWRARDQRWLKENEDLLSKVFQWFLTHEEWPDVTPLQHSLFQEGDRTTKVQAVANARPAIPGQFAPGMLPSIWLGARHLIQIRGTPTLLDLTVKAARAAVKAFLSAPVPGKPVSLPSAAVGASRPGSQSTLRLIPNFVGQDQPAPLVGGDHGDEWVMGINESVVMDFENVDGPEDYVARQLKIIRGWCEAYDARRGAVEKGGPYRAFIVMPFEEPWSETSRAFIDQVIDSLEEEIEAVRADDIDDPGRITQQIIDLLESCDFIIAERALHLTGVLQVVVPPRAVRWWTLQARRVPPRPWRRGWDLPWPLTDDDVAVSHGDMADGELEHPVEDQPSAA